VPSENFPQVLKESDFHGSTFIVKRKSLEVLSLSFSGYLISPLPFPLSLFCASMHTYIDGNGHGMRHGSIMTMTL
jgi:hypothetical protein